MPFTISSSFFYKVLRAFSRESIMPSSLSVSISYPEYLRIADKRIC
uniref:Uncharacterized protein n=1 Tax=Dulem virus 42 TaxID=3145760 RepID=A0AAU8B9G7_9CAUD